MRGVTSFQAVQRDSDCISTHTPHARRDETLVACSLRFSTFQLTRLMRGVTVNAFILVIDVCISTHTPHARRDFHAPQMNEKRQNFNSHASCEA